MGLWIPILVIGGTGIVCGAVLAAASRFFAVHEDPRLEALAELLPGINCGACGFAGCSEYARAMLEKGIPVNLCKPGGHETVSRVASFLGVEAVAGERQVALVLCKGDDAAASRSTLYNGLADCAAAELAGGGGKDCRFGCLGLGTCARVCPVGAIEITAGRLAVVHPELCIGCRQCVAACPRRLIKMAPESSLIHVLCNSHDRGPLVRKVCRVGCIACTVCVKLVNEKGIRMKNNLAVVDYEVPLDNDEVVSRCPQHTIERRRLKKTVEV